ncbi:MAG: crotonase/enoyl-CoA hydratase family protein [Proteobacteria bacterium]|nr:crotonase/enoyl-CoA hydratase family protein [Pseudomonadota bacterium]
MSYSCFNVETIDKVAHVSMNRPDELNTMNRAFWDELPQLLKEIDRQAEARAVVISSTGRHFTAGLDLNIFKSLGGQREGEVGRLRERLRQSVLDLQESFNIIEKIRMPVIAAVQGGCIGGGVDLISACDMRYCTADAYFCIMEINVGMTADVGTLQRLPHLIPSGVVRELAYTGRKMPAQEAKEIGLVNGVFDDHQALLEGVLETAAEIASKSPLAIYGTKEMLNFTRDHTVQDGLNYIATWQTGMFQNQDVAESLIARSEKRDPLYDDLLSSEKKPV